MDRKLVENTPVFILAGGLGTRLSEETSLKPKPMVEVGEIPIILHIMRWYFSFGFNDFVICAGYKSWEIKRFFMNYEKLLNHIEIDHRVGSKDESTKVLFKNSLQENWRVRVFDTGIESMTGARVARAFDLVSKFQKIDNFALTYGDGVCDVDLLDEFSFHLDHGKTGTVMGVRNPPRFGELKIGEETKVTGFLEKPESKQGYINGGFFFFKSDFRKYLSPNKDLILERKPLEDLSNDHSLKVYKHHGFWQPMDTLRDKRRLEELWEKRCAPWHPGEAEKIMEKSNSGFNFFPNSYQYYSYVPDRGIEV